MDRSVLAVNNGITMLIPCIDRICSVRILSADTTQCPWRSYSVKSLRLIWRSARHLHRWNQTRIRSSHYDDVIMGVMASQITSLTIVYWTVYSGADQSKRQSSTSLAFVWKIHRGPVNSPHKWPVTRKMFPFDDVIMKCVAVIHKVEREPG